MQPSWLEELEAVARNEPTRRVLLRMAALSRRGRTATFLREVERDEDLDDATKREVIELAEDERFLRAVEAHLGGREVGDPDLRPPC